MTGKNLKRWLSMLLACALLLGALSGCSVEWGDLDDLTGEPGSTGSVGASGYEAEVVRLVNEIRAEHGLPKLSTNSALSAAAEQRVKELPRRFSHTRPDDTSCYTILKERGISCRAVGENIAAGQPTPAAVVEGWMNSSGHRANILNSKFTAIGVGYTTAGDQYGCYWVQLFTG